MSFRDEQRAYWQGADEGHFEWQTRAPYISATEAALVDGIELQGGERLLEIGCGEGGNLWHLAARVPAARLYGTDFSPPKAAFARRATGASTVCADAAALPFCDAAFDVVLIRDLLHHVADRDRVLAEAHRVLRPGGRLHVIEPNALAPLILAQAAAIPAERGVLRSTASRLQSELTRAGFAGVTVERRQPLPLARIVLHPRLGAARLGGVPSGARALDAVERAARLLPRPLWMYLLCHGRKL